MSTHVDGASPSVAPEPDDDDPHDVAPSASGMGAGSEWVRVEMQRRMAANRSTRGRHARRGEPSAPARREPASPPALRRREQPRPVDHEPWGTDPVPPADLPENYVPKHSVQTPGPAAEPAPPISGPIPVVRPLGEGGAVVNGQPVGNAPIGGPSLPPTGLPRRRKGSGPGTPLQGEGPAAGPWSRPGPIVPNEPARRLGAPPEALRTPDPASSWGLPLVSPPRGFVVPVRPAGIEPGAPLAGPDTPGAAGGSVHVPPVRPETAAEPTLADDAGRAPAGERAPAVPDEAGVAEQSAPKDDDVEADTVPGDAVVEVPPGAVEQQAYGAATDEDGRGMPTGAASSGGAGAPVSGPAVPNAAVTHAAPNAAVRNAAVANAAVANAPGPSDEGPAAAPVDPGVPDESDSEITDEITGEITDEITDPPTAPHPVVLARSKALSGRLVGVPAQRTREQGAPHRTVTPRPTTSRNIPIVGTAPPEPGSTRVRVVLSERKGVARPVRTIKEVQEGTAVGELLRRDLIRSQLLVTLRFAALTVLVLGALPALFALLPEISRMHVLGVRLPWLLLGLLMYPFLVGVAWRYIRVADRVEQNFADHVQD